VPGLEQAISVKEPAPQPPAGGDNNATCGVVKVPPFTVIATLTDDATKENHMPLLAPAVKHDGGDSVPVIPVLLYAPAAEHPPDETKIAVEQSSPDTAKAEVKKRVIIRV
jgi:hypothetical protein